MLCVCVSLLQRSSQAKAMALTFIPSVEHTNSMIELSWLLWKYMATSNNISPKEADTPAALSGGHTCADEVSPKK